MFVEDFKIVQRGVHENAKNKGWWEDDDDEWWREDGGERDGTKIALMHSELSEALEALREGDKYSKKIPEFKHVTEELADVVIRIMDYCERRNLRLAEAILAKNEYNKSRSYKHGGKCF